MITFFRKIEQRILLGRTLAPSTVALAEKSPCRSRGCHRFECKNIKISAVSASLFRSRRHGLLRWLTGHHSFTENTSSFLEKHFLMHESHDYKSQQQIQREKSNAQSVGDEAEYRRHQTCSHICKRHLNSHHCLRIVPAEIIRRRVNDGRIDWSAAKSQKHQSHERHSAAKRQQQSDNSKKNNTLTKPDHLCIAQFYSEKTT